MKYKHQPDKPTLGEAWQKRIKQPPFLVVHLQPGKTFSSPKSKTHANACHQKARTFSECHNYLATTKCCNLLTNSLQTSIMTSNPWIKLQNNFPPLNVIL